MMSFQANYSYQSLPRSSSKSLVWGQDEIGTPHTVTIDFQTLEDNTVTIRNRDTTAQNRKIIGDLPERLNPDGINS